MGAPRLGGIDAARGAAMLFVFLAHFSVVYFPTGAHLGETMRVITRIASPSFMLISGFTAGFIFTGDWSQFRRFERVLRGRAFFLLTVAHGLLVLSQVYRRGFDGALRVVFIVDAIAVAIIVGVPLLRTLSVVCRLLLAVGLLAFSWVAAVNIHPQSVLGTAVAEALWGAVEYRFFEVAFSLLPWLGIYLLGTCIGEQAGHRMRAGRDRSTTVGLYLAGFSMMAAVVALKALYRGAVAAAAVSEGGLAYVLTSPHTKAPPGPAYVLFYGGASLTLVATAFLVEARGWMRPAVRFLKLLGRTSLFLFVAQYYVYYTLMPALGTPRLPYWPLHLAASVALLGLVASVWYRRDYNRLLKVNVLPGNPGPNTVYPIRGQTEPL